MYKLESFNFNEVLRLEFNWMERDHYFEYRRPALKAHGWYQFMGFNGFYNKWQLVSTEALRTTHVLESGICYKKPHIHVHFTDGHVYTKTFETREEAEQMLEHLTKKHNLENLKK